MDEITRHRYPALAWKSELRYCRFQLEGYERLSQGTAAVCGDVERYVMHGALAFRKLLDRRALSEEVIEGLWPVDRYPCTRIPESRRLFEGTIDLENLHHFVRYYDMDAPSPGAISLQRLANALVHSLVFAVWPAEEGGYDAARFFFTSDYDKAKFVHGMAVSDFHQIVEAVSYDEVVYFERVGRDGAFRQHDRRWVIEQGLRPSRGARSPTRRATS
jgi:hypothetical protein